MELQRREAARSNLLRFTEWTTPRWTPGPIHDQICEAFELVVEGKVDRLMLLCPPQHGKSTIASKRAPAYFLGRKPHWEVICASATKPLAEEFGGAVRNCIASEPYRTLFPSVDLAEDTNAKGRWATTQGGGYYAVGVGSALMGRGGELGIIDDPFATWEDAQSALEQQRVWQWYTGTFYNRIRPDSGAIIVIQHRMHVADLVGRLLDAEKNGGDKWHVVKLAADPDNPPWPQRYHRLALERLKMNTESRQWNALYMQEPVPAGGGEFKRDWIEWYNEAPTDVAHNCNRYILIDPASGRRKDKDNDFTSMWVIGCAEDRNYYVLDLVRDKLTLTERATTLIQLHRKWKPYQVRYEHIGMQGDIEFIRELQRQQNYRFSITEVGGTVEKNTRIRRLIPIFEGRRVWFPHTLHRTQHDGVTRNLVDQFIEEELLAFPGPRHDDSLDALARIVEPDMPVVWPKGDVDEGEKKDRYALKAQRKTSAWAAA